MSKSADITVPQHPWFYFFSCQITAQEKGGQISKFQNGGDSWLQTSWEADPCSTLPQLNLRVWQ